jgi:uncharacterized Zn finger protein
MKIRNLKNSVKIMCKDDKDLNIKNTCNKKSKTNQVVMLNISDSLLDYYVRCNVCGTVFNHKWRGRVAKV